MTETTTVPAAPTPGPRLEESFSKYRFDANAVSGRTDTPDLMAAFSTETRDLAAAYREAAADDRVLAEADMAAGFESLPE